MASLLNAALARRIPYLHASVNMGRAERILCAVGGGALVVLGARRKLRGRGLGLATTGVALVARAVRGHCPLYQTLGISTAETPPNVSVRAKQGVRVEESVTVNRPARELYDHWRRLENLPRIMSHLESVERLAGNRSHWVACGPAGMRVEWDAEVLNDVEGELLAWRSLEGSTVDSAGCDMGSGSLRNLSP